MNHNTITRRILHNLEFLLYLEQIQKNVFKQKAYKSSIEKIQQYGNIEKLDHISNIGLGDKIKDKVTHIFSTNSDLPQIQENKHIFDKFQSIKLIESIHNIGHKKATDLVMNHNIITIEDLYNNKHLLNENQIRGLDYYYDINKPIPRKEMDVHNAFITNEITKIYPDIKCNIVGSYRRGSMQSGDIDVIICIPGDHDDDGNSIMDRIIKEFQKKKYVPKNGIFANGKTKFMGMCKLSNFDIYRRIDILLTNKFEYPFALLYFTGSKNLNIHMREKAKKMGYVLNEKGFVPNTTTILTEYDIFNHLEMEFIEPENRDLIL